MDTVFVLIDFDNLFTSDITTYSSEYFEYFFSDILIKCEKEFSKIEYIHIKLYGGWYKEHSLTKKASVLQQLLSKVNVFPKVHNGKVLNGKIDLVSSLHDIPDYTWGFTYKEKNGIGRIRINHELIDEPCNSNRDLCPKFILYKFTKTKGTKCHLPNCENFNKDVFKGIEQKMVDTLIACDILSIVNDETAIGIALYSDDQDHFPSLAMASRKIGIKGNNNLQNILLYYRNEMDLKFVRSLLKPFNIQIKLINNG
jgi:uncharacterized LabA/DUF88 family protein